MCFSACIGEDEEFTQEAFINPQPTLLEKEMAICSRMLIWKIPWTEEPGGLHSIGSQGVKHDCLTATCNPLFPAIPAIQGWKKARGSVEVLQHGYLDYRLWREIRMSMCLSPVNILIPVPFLAESLSTKLNSNSLWSIISQMLPSHKIFPWNRILFSKERSWVWRLRELGTDFELTKARTDWSQTTQGGHSKLCKSKKSSDRPTNWLKGVCTDELPAMNHKFQNLWVFSYPAQSLDISSGLNGQNGQSPRGFMLEHYSALKCPRTRSLTPEPITDGHFSPAHVAGTRGLCWTWS